MKRGWVIACIASAFASATAARADSYDDELAQAIAHDRTGCRAGDVEACFDLADRLPWHDGGFDKEATGAANRAIAILERGCHKRVVASCARLTNVTPYRDYEYELRWARVACNVGDGVSCSKVADDYEMNPDDPKMHAAAVRYRQAACDHRDGFSCTRLAGWLEQSDPPRARRLFERGCALEDMLCLHLAYQLDPDDPRRPGLVERARRAGFYETVIFSTK